jgi:hypothetical protein
MYCFVTVEAIARIFAQFILFHNWPDLWTGESYDRTQWDESVHDGDVIVCDMGRTVAILVQAWPTVVFGERGEFHELARHTSWATLDDGRYAGSYDVARSVAVENGLIDAYDL